jgi:hypothetical protein
MNYLTSPNRAVRAKSFYGDVKTTTETTIYTCPPNCTAEITFLHTINVSGTNTVSLKIYVAATAYVSNFLVGKNMSAGEYLTFVPVQIFLSPGDQVRVKTDSAGHVDTIGSVVETFVPVG